MPTARIYLKSVTEGKEKLVADLYHEGGHARHIEMPISFSEAWKKRLPIRRFGVSYNDRRLMEQGIVHPYAAFDYNKDRSIPPILPDSPGKLVYRNGIDFISHDDPVPLAIADIQSEYKSMPRALTGSVKSIQVYSKLGPEADATIVWDDFDDQNLKGIIGEVTEDIAVHTEKFVLAHMFPLTNTNTLRMIHENHKTRERLEILAENGFVREVTATRLLDPHFARHWISEDVSQQSYQYWF